MQGSNLSQGWLSSLVGEQAEHMVISHFLSLGYPAFQSSAGLSYDVVVEINRKLYKVQVKAVSKSTSWQSAKKQAYRFKLKDGCHKRYKAHHYDIMALVAIDTGAICFFLQADLDQRSQITISPGEINNYPFQEAIKPLCNPPPKDSLVSV